MHIVELNRIHAILQLCTIGIHEHNFVRGVGLNFGETEVAELDNRSIDLLERADHEITALGSCRRLGLVADDIRAGHVREHCRAVFALDESIENRGITVKAILLGFQIDRGCGSISKSGGSNMVKYWATA